MKLIKSLAISIILPTIFLTGCWSSHEINTLAISMCIGIDKTKTGYLVSEQVLNPKAISSSKATNESPVMVFTTEGEDLEEAIRKFTSQSSRKLYHSHVQMVVVSEDVAKDGLNDILDFFARDREFRTDYNFIVAKNTTANKILSILTPIDSIPGVDMFNSLKTSEKNWAPTKSIRIIELINSIIADGKNPVLTGVEISNAETYPDSTDDLKQSSKLQALKFNSLGAFRKDKLVGWLNEDESKGYNYIIGNVTSSSGYVNYGDNVRITSEIINAKSVMKASLIDGRPAIDVEINVNVNINAVAGEFDVSKEENIKIFNELSENKIKLLCESVLNKAQNSYKTDIFGFGEVLHRKYPELWEEIKDDWNNEFTDIPVNFTVKVKTNQLGQVTKSFFIKEKE